MTISNIFTNTDGTVSVNSGSKSIVVPANVWEKIKDHISFLTWGELSSLVAHATRGVDIYSNRYSNRDTGNSNPNADRNWGRRK